MHPRRNKHQNKSIFDAYPSGAKERSRNGEDALYFFVFMDLAAKMKNSEEQILWEMLLVTVARRDISRSFKMLNEISTHRQQNAAFGVLPVIEY